MASPLELDDLPEVTDDFYALLNVSRDAKKEEINQAYKQLTKIFHPDKHLDPVKKKNADLLFSKLKRAHSILMDEHKRVIYDLYGEKGLENLGLEVVARTKTPAEIIADYERMQQEQEERRLQQRTNPRSSVVVEVNATELFDTYDEGEDEEGEFYEDDYSSSVPNVELSAVSIHQSVECPLTSQNTVVFSGNVASRNGRGQGTVCAMWKRWFQNRSTLEVESAFGSDSGIIVRFSKPLFRALTGSCSTRLKVTPRGLIPRADIGLVYTFDKNWQGRLKYNLLNPSSVSSILVYNSDTQQVLLQVMLSIKSSFFFASYTRKFAEKEGGATAAIKLGTLDMVMEYGIEKKVSTFSTLGATVSIGLNSGVMLRLKMDRGNQTLVMPVRLSEDIVPSAIFYATLTPLITYFCVKKLIVDPFLSGKREKDLEKQKQEQQDSMLQRKKEAQALIELMTETVERSREVEERKNGLIIVTALYGKLTTQQGDLEEHEYIDVTLPLQALVKDSKLISPEKNSKSSLPGFYDPCLGEEKKLYIKYKFRKKLHHVTLSDTDNIRLPQQKHLMKEDEEEPFQFAEEPDN